MNSPKNTWLALAGLILLCAASLITGGCAKTAAQSDETMSMVQRAEDAAARAEDAAVRAEDAAKKAEKAANDAEMMATKSERMFNKKMMK